MGQHRNPDEIDTAKVVIHENRRVEFQSVLVVPHVRTQIEIVPEQTMSGAVLHLTQDLEGHDVSVEQIAVGHFVVIVSPGLVSDYKFGRPIVEDVGPQEPLKILLINRGPKSIKVYASLVVVEKPGVYSIVKKETP
jgi:hypothetical protein